MASRSHTSGLALLPIVVAGVLAVPADAQRVSRVHYEDVHNGYRFRPPDDWANIPPQPDQLEAGIVCKLEGDPKAINVDGRTYFARPDLTVLVTRDGGGDTPRPDVVQYLGRLFDGLDDPEVDKAVKASRKMVGRHRTWIADTGQVPIVLDTYVFALADADVSLVFTIVEEHWKKWRRTFDKVAKSFEEIERHEVEYEEGGTYEDLLSYHAQIVARTPGWRVLPTPSEKFIVKTSSDDTQFVEEVIERLELSRELFERDFPPTEEFDDVSVVRICATEEEFHAYGDTGRGVGGWFSPETVELVLYDYKNVNRNATYAVMSHEAFHQYCHFLFDRSEAHRWFDEGHGDYYGGVQFKHGKAEVTKKMPAGFDRLPVIKQMVQAGEYAPLRKHLTFDHRQWQTQGPTNVSCYGQSWSIVYFLRKGMLGEVSSKVWRDEYAEILPGYVTTLYEGFQEAYAEILAEREAEAKEEGRELTPAERDIARADLDEERKHEIWDAAFDASWGRIDLDRFEEDWLTFVRKHL